MKSQHMIINTCKETQTKMDEHTLSFLILDDMHDGQNGGPGYGPIHIKIRDLSKDAILAGMQTLAAPFLKYIARKKTIDVSDEAYHMILSDEEDDPSDYFFSSYYDDKDVVKCLFEDKYFCWNRFQKYYVIAYAIDYNRFAVFSKDCKTRLVKWRSDDKKDPIYSEYL
jgi:hypothetical protein